MTDETMRAFTVGFAAGSLVSGAVGFYFGRRVSKTIARPEFRIVMAAVILFIWALAQLLSLAFGTQVDPWLNGIMGAVAGFFFGDGVVENFRKDKNDK